MDARMQARRALELDLRKAIVNGEFELYYTSPSIDIKADGLPAVKPSSVGIIQNAGMVMPLEFIPVAEKNRSHRAIGEMDIAAGLYRSRALAKAGDHRGDVSPAQFKSRNLVPTVINALATSGLSADRLELESPSRCLFARDRGSIRGSSSTSLLGHQDCDG